MNQEITFFVEGLPRAKQSFRATRHGKGYTPAYIKAWQTDVAWAGQRRMRALGRTDLLTGNLTVKMIFFLPDAHRIDLVNLTKCAEDGLNGVVWVDDHRNITLILDKYICRQRQGVLIQVTKSEREIEISPAEMENILYQYAPGWAVIGANT